MTQQEPVEALHENFEQQKLDAWYATYGNGIHPESVKMMHNILTALVDNEEFMKMFPTTNEAIKEALSTAKL